METKKSEFPFAHVCDKLLYLNHLYGKKLTQPMQDSISSDAAHTKNINSLEERRKKVIPWYNIE